MPTILDTSAITSLVDYTLTNQTVSLSGTYNYDNFTMVNSTINVSSAGLTINAAVSLSIDSTSKIIATGTGYGSSGPGSGGRGDNIYASGGGGYGGRGGNGASNYSGAGGGVYGTQNGLDLDKGSGAGDQYTYGSVNRPGGTGGGLIYLNGPTITIRGQLISNGNPGLGAYSPQSVGGSGGGSGGGILIYGDSVDIRNATINANGGTGGQGGAYACGGGGGGGGRVKVFYRTIQNTGTIITVNGAGGGSGGVGISQSGSIGTVTSMIPTGSASFTSSPSGARIWINGSDTGVNTPGTIPNLYAGSNNYTLKLAGYQDTTGTFTVSYGLTTTVPLVTLILLPGNIYITSTPSGARIYIDNIDRGVFTPNTIYNLSVGIHNVKLTYPNYYDYTSNINILTNQTISINPTLSPLPGNLHIYSNPLGARIYIDNIDQGVSTEATITNISIGDHTVKLTHNNYQDLSTTVTINSNQTTDINSILTLLPGIVKIDLVTSFARPVAFTGELIDYGTRKIYWNGAGSIFLEKTIVDDKIILNVTSGTGTFTHQYSPCGGVPLSYAGPFDITSIFSPGYNDLNIQVQDVCGLNIGTQGITIDGPFATCTVSPKYSGNDITLKATPKDGVGPYYVEFRKNGVAIDPSRLGGSNPIINAPEDIQITRVYTLDDLDISSALTGTIDFSVYMEDSCPTIPMTCSDTCTINIGCLAPVCNFSVT